jgi:hypothetical protein
MAGSAVGQAAVKGARAICKDSTNIVKSLASTAVSPFKSTCRAFGNFVSSLFS